MEPVTQLSEVAAALAEHGELLCAASVELPKVSESASGPFKSRMTVTLEITAVANVFDVVSLRDDLQHVIDMGNLRALAEKYHIDAPKLEALLRRKG